MVPRFLTFLGGMRMNRFYQTTVCIVGAGGIGANLIRSLVPALSVGEMVKSLGGVKITIFDSDFVSKRNLAHQGYLSSDIGVPKALALENSLISLTGNGVSLEGVAEDLLSLDMLSGFDLVVVCVDSPRARLLVHENGGKWLDLRCRGDCFVAVDYRMDDVLISKMTDPDQMAGSCQHQGALDSGRIQFGHLSASSHGCQWVIQELIGISGGACMAPFPVAHSVTFGTLERFEI